MSYATAKSAKKTDSKKTDRQRQPSEQAPLHLCYGQIGISAVAAAARYQGGAKNTAYAPVVIKPNAARAALG